MMQLNDALRALGELLQADRQDASIVVVGGMSLYLLGLVERATLDVDVIALATGSHDGEVRLQPPDPLPAPLARGIATVARDLGLPPDWMNTEGALQWRSGLPPTLAADIEWRRYGGLSVGSSDDGPSSR